MTKLIKPEYSSRVKPDFAQKAPRYFCKYEKANLETSLALGYEIKCRQARCSLACNLNWRRKHAACVSRNLRDRPSDCQVYRGHLRLPPNSTPEDHKKTRKEFLRIMGRWKQKHNYIFEIHGIMDFDSATEIHWDTVAYSNAPISALRQAISDAWRRAGGLRQSLVSMDDYEIVACSKYQAKDLKVDRSQSLRGHNLIPECRQVLGLENHWSTRGFWQGRSVDKIWRELIQEWFGDPVSNKEYNILEPTSGHVSNKEYNILEPNPTPPLTDSDYQMLGLSNKDIRHLRTNLTPDQKRQLQDFRQKIQHRLDLLSEPNTVIKRISYYFPTNRTEALPVGLLANQWGFALPYFRSILDRIPGLQIDLGGIGGTDRYWIQRDPNQSDSSLSRSIAR